MSDDLKNRLINPESAMRPTISDGRRALARIEELEAKLARAVEAVDEAHTSMLNNCDAEAYRILDTALAELKGENDDQ